MGTRTTTACPSSNPRPILCPRCTMPAKLLNQKTGSSFCARCALFVMTKHEAA